MLQKRAGLCAHPISGLLLQCFQHAVLVFQLLFDASMSSIPPKPRFRTHPQGCAEFVVRSSSKLRVFSAFVLAKISKCCSISSALLLKTQALQCFQCIHPCQNLQVAISLVHSLKVFQCLKCFSALILKISRFSGVSVALFLKDP